jgi:hypothetical protein
MNEREWWREAEHPYQSLPKTAGTHGHLRKTRIEVPAYSTFAVPFLWMLRESQERIDDSLPTPLPPDEDPPFESPWVFSAARQQALSQLFFGRLTAGQSLVFFYTKSGHPLGDHINRLVVGAGEIIKVGPMITYDVSGKGATYPMWDRIISHSIRPDGHKGFLLSLSRISPTHRRCGGRRATHRSSRRDRGRSRTQQHHGVFLCR